MVVVVVFFFAAATAEVEEGAADIEAMYSIQSQSINRLRVQMIKLERRL